MFALFAVWIDAGVRPTCRLARSHGSGLARRPHPTRPMASSCSKEDVIPTSTDKPLFIIFTWCLQALMPSWSPFTAGEPDLNIGLFYVGRWRH